MKTRFFILALCLLTARSSFSQHIQVEAGDTVAVVPIEQIRQANVLFVQKDSMQDELEHYQLQVCMLDSTISTYRLIDQTQKDEILLEKRRVSLFQTAFKNCRTESKQARTNAFLIGLGAGAILDIGIRLLALIL